MPTAISYPIAIGTRMVPIAKMKRLFVPPGASILEVEVTNVSKHDFWLLLGDEELFVPFSEFPWFKEAPISKILHVDCPHSHYLYWPDLDVDLAVESIRHPEKFPLLARNST